jgi:hypothetical protein
VVKITQEGRFIIYFFYESGNPHTGKKTRRNTGIPVNTGQLAPLNTENFIRVVPTVSHLDLLLKVLEWGTKWQTACVNPGTFEK